MRCCTKKTHYHATRIIKIILLLIIPLKSYSVYGQISHQTEYEIHAGRRNGGVGGASGDGGGAGNDSGEDESISSQPNGIHSNGEILGPKSFPLSAQEPSCEELRAMWIFSKRQSRAAEMSNEIPTYRDPFAYNIWEPFYSPGRGVGSRTIGHNREAPRPVFGRVISREPIVLQRLPIRTRIFDDVPSKLYGSETRSGGSGSGVGARRHIQYRFSGTTPYGNAQGNNANLVHQGSFQKLKELIWTERAKELTQQRRTEELAARAAVLKELSAGQLINRKPEQNDEAMLSEQNLSPDQQDHLHPPYHHLNTDSRLSMGNSKEQPGVMRSIFSGNPLNPNSPRSGRLLLPGMIGSDARERGNLQRNFPMRPSHFRERNRVLFRQSTPSDFYQRQSRSGSILHKQQPDKNSKSYNSANHRNIMDINNQYTNMPKSSKMYFPQLNEIQLQQQQKYHINDLFQKLYETDKNPIFSAFNSRTKLDFDDSNSIGRDNAYYDRNKDILSNLNLLKHSFRSDVY